jgi:hypothetical protein
MMIARLLRQVVIEVCTAAVNAILKRVTRPLASEPPHKPEPPHVTGWDVEQVDHELGAVGKRR